MIIGYVFIESEWVVLTKINYYIFNLMVIP